LLKHSAPRCLFHLKSWLVEKSPDGENWQEVAGEEGNKLVKGSGFTIAVAVAGGGGCYFIQLVNIDRTHFGNDALAVSA
jgi:hypothetical protein